MSLIKCSNCGHMISDKAEKCPKCGCVVQKEDYALENDEKIEVSSYEGRNRRKWVIAAILLCLITGGIFYAIKSNKNDSVITLPDDDSIVGEIKNDSSESNAIVELTPEFIRSLEQYDELGIFNDGYAAVRKGDKWGYINTKGEEVIPPTIDARYVGVFSEGYAVALLNSGRISVIDEKGESVFSIVDNTNGNYDGNNKYWTPFFKNGKIFIYNSKDHCEDVYDNQGNIIDKANFDKAEEYYRNNTPNPHYSLYSINDDNNWGVKDYKGDVVVEAKYDLACICSYNSISAYSCGTISNGVVLVSLDEIKSSAYEHDGELIDDDVIKHYGYADFSGNDTFSDDLRKKCEESKKGRYGDMDIQEGNSESEDMYAVDSDGSLSSGSGSNGVTFRNLDDVFDFVRPSKSFNAHTGSLQIKCEEYGSGEVMRMYYRGKLLSDVGWSNPKQVAKGEYAQLAVRTDRYQVTVVLHLPDGNHDRLYLYFEPMPTSTNKQLAEALSRGAKINIPTSEGWLKFEPIVDGSVATLSFEPSSAKPSPRVYYME